MVALRREVCESCSKSIYIGQATSECHKCQKIIHTKCFSNSNLVVFNNKIACRICSQDITKRYNPFSCLQSNSLTESNDNHFYDIEPGDVIESIDKMSNILDECDFNSSDTFRDTIVTKDIQPESTLSSIFCNIDGNKSNFDSFVTELKCLNHQFSVIGIAETNTDPDLKNVYQIPEYNSFYQKTIDGKSKGSGVALYIHSSLTGTINKNLSQLSPNLESLFVDIGTETNPLTIGVIYRPPNGNIDEFMTEMQCILHNTPSMSSYIMGDFNINLHDMKKTNSVTFENIVLTSGFSPLISTYTHEKPDCTPTCIDNILTNNFEDVLYTGTLELSIGKSHHFPVFQFSTFNNDNTDHSQDAHIQYYDFCNSNLDNFNAKLTETLETNPLAHTQFSLLSEIIENTIDKTCKLEKPKTSKRNSKNNPWITTGIIESVKTKHRLFNPIQPDL